MKDEIKEILDKLKSLDYDEYNLEVSMDYIERKEEKLLLDCITNLQKEVNKLTAESTEWESKCYKYQEIINELEKLIDSYEIGKYDYQIPVFVLKDKIKSLKEGK